MKSFAVFFSLLTFVSVSHASYVRVRSRQCSEVEYKTLNSNINDCQAFCFVNVDANEGVTGDIRCFPTSDAASVGINLKHESVLLNALLMGLDEKVHRAQINSAISKSLSAHEVLEKLWPLTEIACKEGQATDVFRSYDVFIAPQLGCL